MAGGALAQETHESSGTEPTTKKPLFEVPDFNHGGFVMSLGYAPFAGFSFDAAKLNSQTQGLGDTFIAEARPQQTASIQLAYTILGHASLGVDFTAVGWNITDPNRGGAGFLLGTLGWHPLQLLWMHEDRRPAGVDLKVLFGAGYGIAGQTFGMDGSIWEVGFDAMFFFSRFFGLGLFGRMVFLGWDKFYWDFNGKQYAPLPQGTGGTFATFGFAMHFRAGD